MKYVGPVRKELGIRTVFNILGPITNPAAPTMGVMGVYDRSLLEPYAKVMENLGIRRGMMAAYGLESLSKKQFDAIVKAYHPYSSAASIYLWHLSDEVTGSVGLAQIN